MLRGTRAGLTWGPPQAAMALRKGSPKERKYDFWNIVLCFIISLDLSTPEHERSLFGTLAYRFISKAAEAVPTDKVKSLGIVLGLHLLTSDPDPAAKQRQSNSDSG